MLEETDEFGGPDFGAQYVFNQSVDKITLPFLPATGEVCAHIIGVRKSVNNYETYISFNIKTVANRTDYPSGVHLVDRRYREFDWLHNRFLQMYTVLFVPPLPGKKALTQIDRYASSFLDRRCSGLQTFLIKSAAHPILSGNPDFVAFLTFKHSAFQDHMQKNPTESLLFSLIGLSSQGQSSGVHSTNRLEDEDNGVSGMVTQADLQPSSAVPTSIPEITTSGKESITPAQFHLSSEMFLRYQTEVEKYTFLCQRMSTLISRMTTQLSTLSYDHGQLAKTLEEASEGAVVGGAEAAAAQAMRRTACATRSLASRLALRPANAFYDSAAFGEAIKRVLKNRQSIQDLYFSLEQEIRERDNETSDAEEQMPKAQPWLSRFSFVPWGRGAGKKKKNQSISELRNKAAAVARELQFGNAQVESEWHRWRTGRVTETAGSLSALTGAFVAYWSAVAEAWSDTVDRLSPPSPDDEKSKAKEPDLLTFASSTFIKGGESDKATCASSLKVSPTDSYFQEATEFESEKRVANEGRIALSDYQRSCDRKCDDGGGS